MAQLYKLDLASGKSYIGVTSGLAANRYAGHELSVRQGDRRAVYHAWRKHGAPKLTVLVVLEDAELLPTEARAVATFGTLAPHGYNMTPGGDFNPMVMPELRAKISAALTGRTSKPFSKEHRAKLSAARVGKKRSPEICHKMSLAKQGNTCGLGYKHTPEARRKISLSKQGNTYFLGKTHSLETRRRLAAANYGKKHSAETLAKMSAANRGDKSLQKRPEARARVSAWAKGRTHSLETRAKIAAAKLGSKNPMCRPEVIAKRAATLRRNNSAKACALSE